MPVATVTSKGQVTIPKEVREILGIGTGTRLTFVRSGRGYLLVPANRNLMELEGTVPYSGPPLTLEEIDQAIGDAAAGLASQAPPDVDEDAGRR